MAIIKIPMEQVNLEIRDGYLILDTGQANVSLDEILSAEDQVAVDRIRAAHAACNGYLPVRSARAVLECGQDRAYRIMKLAGVKV